MRVGLKLGPVFVSGSTRTQRHRRHPGHHGVTWWVLIGCWYWLSVGWIVALVRWNRRH